MDASTLRALAPSDLVRLDAVLDRVGALIEQGWNQNKARVKRDGRIVSRCLSGALDDAFYALQQEGTRHAAFDRILVSQLLVPEDGDVVSFNDEEGRTVTEVIERVEGARKQLTQLPQWAGSFSASS